jgi:hypothetical protein
MAATFYGGQINVNTKSPELVSPVVAALPATAVAGRPRVRVKPGIVGARL